MPNVKEMKKKLDDMLKLDFKRKYMLGSFENFAKYCEDRRRWQILDMGDISSDLARAYVMFAKKNFKHEYGIQEELKNIENMINNMKNEDNPEDNITDNDISEEDRKKRFKDYQKLLKQCGKIIDDRIKGMDSVDAEAAPADVKTEKDEAAAPAQKEQADVIKQDAFKGEAVSALALNHAINMTNLKMEQYLKEHKNEQAEKKLKAFNDEFNSLSRNRVMTDAEIKGMAQKYDALCEELKKVSGVDVRVSVNPDADIRKKEDIKKLDPNAIAYMDAIQKENDAVNRKIAQVMKGTSQPEPAKQAAPKQKEYVDTDFRNMVYQPQKAVSEATSYDTEDIIDKLDVMEENMKLCMRKKPKDSKSEDYKPEDYKSEDYKKFKKLRNEISYLKEVLKNYNNTGEPLTVDELKQVISYLNGVERDAADYVITHKDQIKYYKNEEGGLTEEVMDTPEGKRTIVAKSIFGMIPDLRAGIEASIYETEHNVDLRKKYAAKESIAPIELEAPGIK